VQQTRVRFTVWKMMLGVAALAGLLGLIRVFDWDPVRSYGIGHTTIPLVFVVRDAESGDLIERATIRLQDRDYDSNPVPPYVLNLKTRRDGQATFGYEASVYMQRRSSPGWEWRVSYPFWELRIGAEGYLEFATSFEGYADQRGGKVFHKGPLPPTSPPIVARLRRQARPEASERATPRL
jgi:hypothetical protein